MWSAVPTRSHHPSKIFLFPRVSKDETKHMIYGPAEYGFNEGGTDSNDVTAGAFVVNHSFRSESAGLGG